MVAPGVPTSLALATAPGYVQVTWDAPASGGTPEEYLIDFATNSGFTGATTVTLDSSVSYNYTYLDYSPGSTHYVRIRARNGDGTSANTTAQNIATAGRTALDVVKGASVDLADGTQLVLRSDGAVSPAITLVAIPFGAAASPTTVATISTNFLASGGPRNFALAADPSGGVYVVGVLNTARSTFRVVYYPRTGALTWGTPVVKTIALTTRDDGFNAVAAAYVPGSGGTPRPSVLIIGRRTGRVGRDSNIGYALIDATAAAGGAGALTIASGENPSWLPTTPFTTTLNRGTVDAQPLTRTSQSVVILANSFAVVKITNGTITSRTKGPNGIIPPASSWGRVVGVDEETFAVLEPTSAGALTWKVYNTAGTELLSGTLAAATASGGAFAQNWDALRDTINGRCRIYYMANDSARHLAVVPFYYGSGETFLTTTLGASGSTNSEVRVPHSPIDERRVVVEAANLNAGVKSIAVYHDLSGNIAPNAPALVDEPGGFDATQARSFSWAFSDSNPLDTPTAYEMQIQRVSDSVNVVSTGKITSTASTRSVAGATLTNGVAYRWRVRTYDALDAVGAWSPYDDFTPTATGTLTITDPVADNPVGLQTANIPITWTYAHVSGYVQTQRRVRVVRVSDSAVLHDSTMQATASQTYSAPVPPSELVRIEVSIVTNAPGTPTIGPVARLLTSAFDVPMTPTIVLAAGVSYISVTVTNPAPTGDRPEVSVNVVERRDAGTADAFVPVGSTEYNGTFDDHTVASGREYDYRVRGVAT